MYLTIPPSVGPYEQMTIGTALIRHRLEKKSPGQPHVRAGRGVYLL
jgi:hypothetical protein